MAGWHHWLDGRESQWTPGVGDGQGGLACWDSWGRKESDTTERLIWSDLFLINTPMHSLTNSLIHPSSHKSSTMLSDLVSFSRWNRSCLLMLLIQWVESSCNSVHSLTPQMGSLWEGPRFLSPCPSYLSCNVLYFSFLLLLLLLSRFSRVRLCVTP